MPRKRASRSPGYQRPKPLSVTAWWRECGHTLLADLAIKALGFDPEDLPVLFDAPELDITRWGTIKVDWRSMTTNLDGVFAAGDIVRGASLVVWAIKDGRDAAAAIHRHIGAGAMPLAQAV